MANFFQNLWDYFNGNIGDREGDAGDLYKQAYSQSNQALQNQKGLNAQYTGNAGYNNTINQGLRGAAVTAGEAGQQATQAARNAGMTKGRAANLGATQAANAYGQNFGNQQQMAAGMGNAAVGANQSLANQYLQNAGMSQSEAQRRYNMAVAPMQTISDAIAGAGKLGTNIYAISQGMNPISDKRTKTVEERYDSLSKMVEGIPMYKFRYTQDAQGKYHVDNDIHNGPMAQDLEKNPITATTVKEDEDGIKHVDTAQLAMQAIGLIGDLSKRISELEEK